MTPEQELQRAERARQILEDDLFLDAVGSIEQALLIALAKSAFTDEKLREKLAQRYALLHDLIGELKRHMETGKLARETLRQRAVDLARQAAGL